MPADFPPQIEGHTENFTHDANGGRCASLKGHFRPVPNLNVTIRNFFTG